MIKDPKIEPEKMSIVSIKTLKGSIESLENTPKEFTFEFETTTGIAKDKKLIRLVLDVKIKSADLETSPNVAFYSHEFIFQIDNFEDFIEWDEEKKLTMIHIDLGRTLASIGYSTVRGIIHVRTQGTVLNGIILPVIDPSKLLEVIEAVK